MCTVTYIPTPEEGFILTSSRDESLTRPPALPPALEQIGGQWVGFPRDPQGQGSWLVASSALTVCLLNGAFEAHQPTPPYAHSRGLVPLAVFGYESTDLFIEHYDFTNLEPFTLLLAEATRLTELRWDGLRRHVAELDPRKAHIWSSATLYAGPVRAERERWFAEWPLHERTGATIRQFHKQAGQHDPANAIQMHRPGQYRTVSLTSVSHTPTETTITYEDLVNQTIIHLSLSAHALI
ncbi:MAG: hypothetical protein EAZ91_19185 [Cytophagales bacterium]|nr:MAG: hypothetical protein EAZ91_19185 [Cytophagales bacterium]